jgi:hypothetical protein
MESRLNFRKEIGPAGETFAMGGSSIQVQPRMKLLG